MAGSLPLKNDVQLVTQLPQSRRQVHDVLSAAESVRPISDSEVTCVPMTRPATLSSSATSSSNSTDFSSNPYLSVCSGIHILPIAANLQRHCGNENLYFTRMIYPVAKQIENNKLTNLTININSQDIQHDEVGNT